MSDLGESTEPSDADLAVRALADRDAFGALYDRYAVAVYRYCYRRLGERAAAEDATSAVFLRALRALPGYRGGSFPAWLFTIAHSIIAGGARKPREHALAVDLDPIDPAASPEDEAIESDQRARIVDLLALLPDEQRRAIELRLAGLSGAEVAAVMGKSLPAVKMMQHRALHRLRAHLESSGHAKDWQ